MHKFKHLDLAGVQRPANEKMDAAIDWLKGHEKDPFAWIHLYDPHTSTSRLEPLASEFRLPACRCLRRRDWVRRPTGGPMRGRG